MTLLGRVAGRGTALATSRAALFRPLQQQVRCFALPTDDPTILPKPKHYNDNIQGQGIGWKTLVLLSSVTFVVGPIYDSSRPTQIHLKVFGSNSWLWHAVTTIPRVQIYICSTGAFLCTGPDFYSRHSSTVKKKKHDQASVFLFLRVLLRIRKVNIYVHQTLMIKFYAVTNRRKKRYEIRIYTYNNVYLSLLSTYRYHLLL